MGAIVVRAATLGDLVGLHDVRRSAILGIDLRAITPSEQQTWADERSRRGVGRAIMASLEAAIANQGHPRTRLEASANAVGFYLALGYAIVGAQQPDGPTPMEKPSCGG